VEGDGPEPVPKREVGDAGPLEGSGCLIGYRTLGPFGADTLRHMNEPDTSYARLNGNRIAYQVSGDGPIDIVIGSTSLGGSAISIPSTRSRSDSALALGPSSFDVNGEVKPGWMVLWP
jgi:hypothetical protein